MLSYYIIFYQSVIITFVKRKKIFSHNEYQHNFSMITAITYHTFRYIHYSNICSDATELFKNVLFFFYDG